MTCIAWDGRVLAADRQGEWNGTKVRVRKVWRVTDKAGRRWLLGGAGNIDSVQQYRDWLRGREEKPKFPKEDAPSLLLIDSRKRAFLVSGVTLVPVRALQRQVAVGSGRAEALGAMAAGKGAADAVRIASRLEASCGMGVDVVRFA